MPTALLNPAAQLATRSRAESEIEVRRQSFDKPLLTTPGAGTACGWFRFALNSAAAFDVFHRLQVTNYGLFYIPFESAPKGPNLIGVWVFCTHGQTAFHNLFRGNVLATSPGERKPKN